jgi:hypothetical protein
MGDEGWVKQSFRLLNASSRKIYSNYITIPDEYIKCKYNITNLIKKLKHFAFNDELMINQ